MKEMEVWECKEQKLASLPELISKKNEGEQDNTDDIMKLLGIEKEEVEHMEVWEKRIMH